ncbi:helix-turn-helix transcriptional regulator (plasmid) [Paenibacillus sonchi]|uniref:Helix-turn-helix transcriptional regulator n=2 Tax=Paenibacillus sonchi TaxID=373687 RepID=A0A974PIW0_9BACL|nr:helix-turn-helix transcriptional regulator [Paenibacillus sonchi]
MVLAELQKGRRYGKQMDQAIIHALDGVGVNDGYLSTRLRKLSSLGHVSDYWDSDQRYFRYYEITESGLEYFQQLLRDLPERVDLALKVYLKFQSIILKYE